MTGLSYGELLGVFSEQRHDEQRNGDDSFLWYEHAEDRLCKYGEAADDARDSGLPILHDATYPDCEQMRRQFDNDRNRCLRL